MRKFVVSSCYFISLSLFLFSCKKEIEETPPPKPKAVEIRDSLVGEYVGIRISEYYSNQLQQVVKDTTSADVLVSKNATDSVIDVKINFPNGSNLFYFYYDSVSFTNIRFYRPSQLSISDGQLYHFWYPSNGSFGVTTLCIKK